MLLPPFSVPPELALPLILTPALTVGLPVYGLELLFLVPSRGSELDYLWLLPLPLALSPVVVKLLVLDGLAGPPWYYWH